MIRWVILFCLLTSFAAYASAPSRSERPVVRGAQPVTQGAQVQQPRQRPVSRPAAPSAPKRTGFLRPILRPAPTPSEPVAVTPDPVVEPVALPLPFAVLRPQKRPRAVTRRAKTRDRAREKELAAGRICGDRAIQGEAIGRVPGKIAGCGVAEAVRVRSVSGVTMSTPAVMDCTTARAVKSLVDGAMKPAFKRTGGGLQQMRVASHYACRTRNNQPGARISEHGKGRAIDISGFTMRDGSTVTVLKGWNHNRHGKALRSIHKKACGPFGTVLGPNSNRFHRDHFHFDTARYRSGPYCR